MGTLYLVATPIGNLEDITARALRVLREVKLIAAEDTRRTGLLLKHFEIHTSLTSYFEHNKLNKLDTILDALASGDVALVSDAGMPAISDPGYELVQAALNAGYNVVPIPGASAVLSALAASGLPTDAFTFLGFLPRKEAGREKFLQAAAALTHTIIVYESPHRLLEALESIEATFGNRRIAVARELTKLHEEIFRGTVREAHAHFSAKEILGEITLVIAGQTEIVWDEARVRETLRALQAQDLKPKDLARRVAEQAGWHTRKVYALLQTLE